MVINAVVDVKKSRIHELISVTSMARWWLVGRTFGLGLWAEAAIGDVHE